jgi:hypothetical protein
MLTTIRYILLTASRDFLFLGLLIGVMLATALSSVLGSTALIENQAMTLSFASASARIVLVLGIMIFVCFHLRQAFEQKEIDVLLSRPLSRFQIMLSYWLGFSLVAFLLVLASVVVISFLPLASKMGFVFWALSLLLESLLVVALAMFAAFTLRSAVSSVLASLGFYVLGRMMAFFLVTLESKLALGNAVVNAGAKGLLMGISLIMPRLDLFGQSDWLVYGIQHPQDLKLAFIQMAVFIPLLLFAATVDFLRKEF